MLRTTTHVQSVESDTWTITHNFSHTPIASVKVYEGGVLTEILPKGLSFPSSTTVLVEFSSPRTGEVRLA